MFRSIKDHHQVETHERYKIIIIYLYGFILVYICEYSLYR
jgi:hypothetical protein